VRSPGIVRGFFTRSAIFTELIIIVVPALPAVIAWLDRATQYSETLAIGPGDRGVLGPRFRGDDGFLSSTAVRLTVRFFPSR
jgi:hypothetical protein